MKNDSNLFPVETPMDSLFDSNKDGELTGFETTMRDAALYDADKYFNESREDYDPSPDLQFNKLNKNGNPQFITSVFTNDDEKGYSNPPSEGASIIGGFGTAAICFGSMALIVAGGIDNPFLQLLLICIAIALSIILLKATGIIAPYKEEVKERKRQRRKERLNNLFKKYKVIFAVMLIIACCIGCYKIYDHYSYEKDYNQAIKLIMNEEYDKGKELLEKYADDGIGYKDVHAWFEFCHAWSLYEEGNISSAASKEHFLKFEYLTPKQKEFVDKKRNIIKNAWDDYCDELDRKKYSGEITVPHTPTTTKHYTTKSYTKKHYTEKHDPYHAKDYADPEDFYDDYYDDFADYEDAEDYYEDFN